MDTAGDLYGATKVAGLYGYGAIFKLTKGSGGWTYTSLHDFTGAEGAYPYGKLVFDQGGNIYGTAEDGGIYYEGVVFEITP